MLESIRQIAPLSAILFVVFNGAWVDAVPPSRLAVSEASRSTPVPIGNMVAKFTDPRCNYDSRDSFSVYVIYVEGSDTSAEYAGETEYICDGVGHIYGTFASSGSWQACVQATSTCPTISCSAWLSSAFGQGPGTVTEEHCQ